MAAKGASKNQADKNKNYDQARSCLPQELNLLAVMYNREILGVLDGFHVLISAIFGTILKKPRRPLHLSPVKVENDILCRDVCHGSMVFNQLTTDTR
ncbi:hypothetical protein HAV15_009080 [Penicillium sp. str. |nr:hypothetical protein HAV15_009080 [Penicillium sp. str. \